jgi:hypothetical protein
MRMEIEQIVESIVARVDRLIGMPFGSDNNLKLSPMNQAELASLIQLSGLIKDVLVPVPHRPAFQAKLKANLLAAASQRLAVQQMESHLSFWRRRWILVGAAAGSAVWVAGIVAAFLVHQRTIRL